MSEGSNSCAQCGQSIGEGVPFCMHCGAKQKADEKADREPQQPEEQSSTTTEETQASRPKPKASSRSSKPPTGSISAKYAPHSKGVKDWRNKPFNSHIIRAIFAGLLCIAPLGVIAIVCSLMASTEASSGNMVKAHKYARISKMCSNWAFILVGAAILFYLLFRLFLFLVAFSGGI